MLNALGVEHLTHHNGGNVDAICNHLNRKVGNGINCFDYACHLKLAILVERAHCIGEVGGMVSTILVGHIHILGSGGGVADTGFATIGTASLNKFFGARKFGRNVPTLHNPRLEQAIVILGNGVGNPFRALGTRHLLGEVRPFKMQSHDGAIGLGHHLLCRGNRLLVALHCIGAERRIDSSGAILDMRFNSRTEGFLRTFHEVASATTMHMQFYTTRHDVCAFGVNEFCICKRQIGVEHLDNLVALNQYTSMLQPSGRSQDFTIINLFEHSIE